MSIERVLLPALDDEPWPTLGPEICDFIEDNLVHGPGDILGKPVELSDEQRLFIYRAYEVFAPGGVQGGRRRFKRAFLSRRKGWAKTELAAWLAICEMDPEGPVRCDGWRVEDGERVPVGRPVSDPYIPMVAVTEEQTEDLAYGAVKAILENCGLGEDYVVGDYRITHTRAPGVIKPTASAPGAREGARTTFQHFDETWGFISPRLRESHRRMLRNIPKRFEADGWSLETSTMYRRGEDSVAEGTHGYARAIGTGEIEDPRLLFDHLQLSDDALEGPLRRSTDAELLEAIRDASGDAWAYADGASIIADIRDPQTTDADARRSWLNQSQDTATQWLPPGSWTAREVEDHVIGEVPVIAFCGTQPNDAAGLVGCTADRHLFVIDAWTSTGDLGVDREAVQTAIVAAVGHYRPRRFVWNTIGWLTEGQHWQALWGAETAPAFDWAHQAKRRADACTRFYSAVVDGTLTQDGDAQLAASLKHAPVKQSEEGTYLSRGGVKTRTNVTLAVAAVIALEQTETMPAPRKKQRTMFL